MSALQSTLNFGTLEICNTNRCSQFTSTDFTFVLLDRDIVISMDDRGRALDNVFCRTVLVNVEARRDLSESVQLQFENPKENRQLKQIGKRTS